MDVEQIHEAGVLSKGEAVSRQFHGKIVAENEETKGLMVLTNERLLFMQKPSGLRAKGVNVLQSYAWEDILSVSTTGLISRKLNLSIRRNDQTVINVYAVRNTKEVVKSIIEHKRECGNQG